MAIVETNTICVLEVEVTANQIAVILIPIGIFVLLVALFVNLKKGKTNQPQKKVHGPHTPGPGYDAKEIVRSKGAGMADGGV
ncbi:hypothetical protein [Roseovarius sp. MMSF_3281]|uniref:hypothetical protein n=1 Tax=Roseovarius sp. MMSF_3281 TaxID=3046694 RepID=UPI00273E6C6C|nr:hypothetical protein [Roseovarius sp. MMSF_3281]